MDTMRGKLEQNSASLRRTGLLFVALGTAAVGAVGMAIKAAADFEKEISKFQAAAQETPEVLEEIRQKALQIGRDTSFGAGQAAEAITALSYAGLETRDILDGAADAAVALAEAGELDIPQAASIAASALNMFNLEAKDLDGVANTLIGTFANTDTMVDELGQAFQQVGATSATLGVSLEDTSAALGLLANRGIKGGKAGTTLNRMLLNLQPSSDKAASAMMELGLITEDGTNRFFDAEGNMKSLADVSEVLGDSLKDLTKEQKAAYLETIFGTRAIAAATAMADAGSEGFNSLAEAISEIDAADVAAEKLDNLSGAMTILRGTIETALIGAGAPFQDVLKGIVQGVTELINRFAQLSPRTQKIIGIVVALGGALFIALGFFLILLSVIPAIAAGFGVFMTTALPIIGVVLAIVAAIALLVLGFKYAWENSERFQEIVRGAIETARDVIAKAVEFIRAVIERLVAFWDEWGDDILAATVATFEFIWSVIETILKVISAIVKGFIDVVQAFWNRFGDTIIHLVKSVWDFVYRTIRNVLNVITGIVQAFIALFRGDWEGLGNALKKIAGAVWDQIVNIINFAIQLIIGIISGIVNIVVGLWNTLWHRIKKLAKDSWDRIVRDVSQGIQDIKTFFKELPGAIVAFLKDLPSMLMNIGKDMIRGFIDGIKNMAGAAADAAREVAGNAVKAVTGLLRSSSPSKLFEDIGEDTFSGFVNGMRGMIDQVRSAASDVAWAAVEPAASIGPSSIAMSGNGSDTGSSSHSENYTFNGDIVLPNVTDHSTADDLLSELRRAVRGGGFDRSGR